MFMFYSFSCEYQKVYQSYVSIIHETYPEIVVEGENYASTDYTMYFAKSLVSRMVMYCCVYDKMISKFTLISRGRNLCIYFVY